MTVPRISDPAKAIGEVLANATAQLQEINARTNWAARLMDAHKGIAEAQARRTGPGDAA